MSDEQKGEKSREGQGEGKGERERERERKGEREKEEEKKKKKAQNRTYSNFNCLVVFHATRNQERDNKFRTVGKPDFL